MTEGQTRASAGTSAADLLAAAEPWFNAHFKLVPHTPDFDANAARGCHLLERALAAARAANAPLPEYQALAMLGIYHSNMSRLDRALDFYERARAVIAANPGVEWAHRPAMNANNTAGVLRKMGRSEEQLRWLERSRAMFEAAGRPVNVLVADLYLGEAYREAGRLAESRAAYERGLAAAFELDQTGEVPWLKWGLGETLARDGDRAGALAHLARAEELFAEGGAEGAAHLPPLRRTIHDVARAAGDAARAARYEALLLEGKPS